MPLDFPRRNKVHVLWRLQLHLSQISRSLESALRGRTGTGNAGKFRPPFVAFTQFSWTGLIVSSTIVQSGTMFLSTKLHHRRIAGTTAVSPNNGSVDRTFIGSRSERSASPIGPNELSPSALEDEGHRSRFHIDSEEHIQHVHGLLDVEQDVIVDEDFLDENMPQYISSYDVSRVLRRLPQRS